MGRVTLQSIAQGLKPDVPLNKWLEWPPDLFALLATVFQRTGCYKICVTCHDSLDQSIKDAPWNSETWQKDISESARLLVINVSNKLLNVESQLISDEMEFLKQHYDVIEKEWGVFDVNDLRTLKPQSHCLSLVHSMITVYAVLDNTCRAIGLLYEPISADTKEHAIFRLTANILLNNTGTLSTLPKIHGIVLPKMRTPQNGLVLRNLSHYLTFHITEVEVVWRTFPMPDNGKRSVNIMVVPHPKYVDKDNFTVVNEKYHSVRYFKGTHTDNDLIFLRKLRTKIIDELSSGNSIDIVVFPEASLNETEYHYFLDELASDAKMREISFLPIIICGIIKEEDDLESFLNEARLSFFFSEKWYAATQRKHHRWSLDKSQILQYKLEDHLATDRNWFEFCTISQRRLTILSPNAWMTLTSLICEDLARQEPVTDILRGVGPTLLVALLSDGPQLVNRWSARYASILADDPGTAVLCVTSSGMAKRTEEPETWLKEDGKECYKNAVKDVSVALWKDMVKGWKEIRIDKNNDCLLFTISSQYKEEFTIDGRTDETNASVFQMDTVYPKQFSFSSNEKKKVRDKSINGRKTAKKELIKGAKWFELRNLSALLFTIDACIDLIKNHLNETEFNLVLVYVYSIFHLKSNSINSLKISDVVLSIIQQSWTKPQNYGIEMESINPSFLKKEAGLSTTIQELMKIVRKAQKDQKGGTIDAYKNIYDELMKISSRDENMKKIKLSFLYNIYTRISNVLITKDILRSEKEHVKNVMKFKNELESEIGIRPMSTAKTKTP